MLRLPKFKHVKPSSLNEILTALVDHSQGVQILAGGTDLLVNMKNGLCKPKVLVSLNSLSELSYILEAKDGTLRIGAGTKLADIAENPLIIKKVPALKDAASAVASWHIRNMATIGGNLCLDNRCWYFNQSTAWRKTRETCHKLGGDICHALPGSKRCYAINSSDTAPILMALDASLVLKKKGHERLLPIRQFYHENGASPTMLEPGEILTEIQLPKIVSSCKTAFIKMSKRKGIDFAAGNIAACLKKINNGEISLQLVLGAMHSAPLFLEKTGQSINESGLSKKTIETAAMDARSELGTLTNLFNSAGYKRDLAQALVKRALESIMNQR
jgi:4-hydroxybenzoyl-CoA reductase beta subunit